MASLTKKIIRGHPYYYARECGWVNGRPRITRTVYLGRVEDIMAAVAKSRRPAPIQGIAVTEFGAVTAVWSIVEELDLIGIIDSHVPKRDQGLSVGQYIALAAVNRATCPKSKRALAAWYRKTILRRLCPAELRQLTSQKFWDHMGYLGEKEILAIETDLCHRIIDIYKIDLRCLALDATNFFTFISTRTKGKLAQRGHNKNGRDDLRQVCLALLASTDFHIPLFHQPYNGNIPDSVEFRTVLDKLVERYATFAKGCSQITLVFDKGNNSQEGMELLDESPYGFIGSLVPTHHPELLAIDRKNFKALQGERLESVCAYRTKKEVFGVERTVLVTFNDNLYTEQLTTLMEQIQKRKRQLHEMQQRLNRWIEGQNKGGKPPTLSGTQKQLDQILVARHMKEVFNVTLRLHGPSKLPCLTYRVNTSGIDRLCRTLFGKTLIFTNRDDWSDEDIVLGYRGQYKIEHAFRTMKNPHFVTWQPMFHWTDQKIRVHAFYCVLALMLTSLLEKKLYQAGLEISIHEALEQLSGIRELLVLHGRGKKKPKATTVLNDMDERQRELFDVLQLKRYLPPDAVAP
ncbi:MAG: IS1634 family transposase [Elusimicrobia bacterium]|nr:IS1634 family transposase [Elusimicrobiota bacterium]